MEFGALNNYLQFGDGRKKFKLARTGRQLHDASHGTYIYLVESGRYNGDAEFDDTEAIAYSTLQKAKEAVRQLTEKEMMRVFEIMKAQKVEGRMANVSYRIEKKEGSDDVTYIHYQLDEKTAYELSTSMPEDLAYKYIGFWNTLNQDTTFEQVADDFTCFFMNCPEGERYVTGITPYPLL